MRLPAEAAEGRGQAGADWETWHAGQRVADLASLQRGARNFVELLPGLPLAQVHALLAHGDDLEIPTDAAAEGPAAAGRQARRLHHDHACRRPMRQTWFGKAPPDLSLIARSRGHDYLYQFLKTFYVDPTRPTGANNLRLPTTAMPAGAVRARGPQGAVFKDAPARVQAARSSTSRCSTIRADRAGQPERRASTTSFVRDTVNFLDYVGEPTQVGAALARHLGGTVPAGVHLACLAAEARVLEGRALIVALGRGDGARAGAESCRADAPS